MKKLYRGAFYFLIIFLTGGLSLTSTLAQEDTYRLSYTDIFGKLRRPAIDFAHELHVAALDDLGCGACHHAPSPQTGQLVYVEDEETTCSECHGPKPDGATPALREAFHGSCNQCHRKMGKTIKNFKGPTTCGECHTPEK